MVNSVVNKGQFGNFPIGAPSQDSVPPLPYVPNPNQLNQNTVEDESKERSLRSWTWERIQKIGKGALKGVYTTFLANGILMNINNAVKEFFHHSQVIKAVTEALNEIFSIIDFAEVLLVPVALSNIGHDIYGLVKGEISVADFLLSTGENLGFIVLAVVDLLKILIKLTVIPLGALKYLTPFSLIKLVLDGINIVSNVKGWVKNHKFAKKMQQLLEDTKGVFGDDVKDYRKVFELFSNEQELSNRSISKIFGLEASSLRARIHALAMPALEICEDKESTVEEKVKAEVLLKEAYQALRGRVKANIVSHQLGLTTALVSTVVHSALFASPYIIAACPAAAPILPTCFAISAANSCVSLSKFIYDIVKKKQFQKSVLFDDTLILSHKARQTISSGNFSQISVS